MTTIDEQLVKYLADAHSIEEQALQQLKGAPKASGDSGLADIFRDHLTETEGHERAIRARLEAHGEGANKLKDLLMKVGGAASSSSRARSRTRRGSSSRMRTRMSISSWPHTSSSSA